MAKSEQEKKRRPLTEEQLDRIAERLPEILGHSMFVEVESGKQYRRRHDDDDGSGQGELVLIIGPDGDVWITTDQHQGPTMRFRIAPPIGGGQSKRTYNALRILALAIKLDNEERRQYQSTPAVT